MIDIEPTIAHRASELLDDALVWDNHGCMPLRPSDPSFLPQLERCRASGVDVVTLNVGAGPLDLATHFRILASFRQWFGARPDQYVLPKSAADIDQAKRDGKLSIVFDIEGTSPLDGGDHGLVQMFYDLGVRWMLLAYNRNNAAGGGCLDDDIGLTTHGRALLDEMKRVGMVVCCSHTGHRTAMAVIEHANNPVIFSHSNANAVHPHVRNISDELIKACAETGGVVGINGVGDFLGQNDARPEAAFRHLDHMVQLVGPEHVGVSLDYLYDYDELLEALKNHPEAFPADVLAAGPPKFLPPESIPALVELMVRHGYDDDAVKAVLGGNWLRVARQVWR